MRNLRIIGAAVCALVIRNRCPSLTICNVARGISEAKTRELMTGVSGSSRPASTRVRWRNNGRQNKLVQPQIANCWYR